MLAAGSTAEVLPGEQDDRTLVLGLVHHELRILSPRGEQKLPEAGALDTLERVARHDLVGVHVGVAQGERLPRNSLYRLHYNASAGTPSSDGEAKRPITAVAAATAGLTRCVLPPLPCRPSKLRLLVEAQRSPGCRTSGVLPRPIEAPAPR